MNCTNNLGYLLYFNQSNNIYNTQGELVNKTQKQLFQDKFACYLKHNTRVDKPIYPTYVNNCYPTCCNPIKWDVSENIIDVKYINNDVCNRANQKKYRIG
jgi:hypothetical protein